MIPAITEQEAVEIMRASVDGAWFDKLISDPDGYAIVMGVVDCVVEIDRVDADMAASLRVRRPADAIGPPASGSQYATTTLEITRSKPGRDITIRAGTICQSVDGHRYALDSDLSWGAGDLSAKTVGATAVSPGYPGVLPPGSIDRFALVANGVTGIGTELTIGTTSGSYEAMKITTDAAKPHLFRAPYVGLYLEITSCGAQPSQVGRQFQIDGVKTLFLDTENLPETRYAWTAAFDSTTSAEFFGIVSDAYEFEWRIRDWSELGFTVRNTVAATGGRYAFLDELARARGRARQAGEGDDELRARLLRAPERPSPLGVLRKAIVALAPYGVTRHQIQIYELGESGPDAADLYAENFPAGGGFVSDLHCSDMSKPYTPVGMYSQSPTYTTLTPAYDPGPPLPLGSGAFGFIVRWDPPSGMSAPVVAEARRLLWQALRSAAPPGAFFQIYNAGQWGF
jgi:hypothetical protein